MNCLGCGSENRAGAKFCVNCGSAFAAACPNGHTVPLGARFCDECGAPVANAAAPEAPLRAAGQPGAPSAERRLVSVLFADLVGFTTLSEARDAEEIRELLTRYFDTCRGLIARYGGTVEKFIGDAVMAVWGTPVAQEDDAERAVRAALDLVEAVSALGEEAGLQDLRVRAGVLTGEAAVTIGAEGEGMVAGDLVNTASRIQAAAEPGAVFVGEATRRSTEAAIAFEEAGSFELKGKAEPVPLWRALRIVAGRRGLMKSEGLEAPFVGRDRELRLIKELFHTSADERKAHLVSVTGVAGMGKSRLAWEFYKYMDGVKQVFLWHRGRCLSYGEGVTYWALVEMIRGRADILEGEDAASAAAKLHVAVERIISNPEERRWVEPRLAHLLGLEERIPDRESLFAAWRLFIERMAEQTPVVLLFEDMQWADAALLDFIEYLLEWSRNLPVFVIVQARPDLFGRRPTWGAGTRNATLLSLEPLPRDAMQELLAGLVPGLPNELLDQILDRAQGVPLYAVETVRMLLDRGLLALEGSAYRPTGPIDPLEVPESLQALIAARLDGLTVEERRTLQDGSVLGKTFTLTDLALFSRREESVIEPILNGLVRKEVLSIQTDPRSPERGQYGFLQDLVKHVAYEMISKKDRKTAHLAAAAFLETRSDEDEIVEVVASHYVDAYRLFPDAPDAGDIQAKASGMLARAGERAASLSALGEAQRFFEQAADLSDDAPVMCAELLERAGAVAHDAGNQDAAAEFLRRSGALLTEQGLTHPAARVAARLAEVLWDRGEFGAALEDMDRAFRVLQDEDPDEDLAALAAQLGRFQWLSGQPDAGLESIETAIDIAESLLLPEVLAKALNTKAVILYSAKGRLREGNALLRSALELSLEHDLPSAALRAYYNLADLDIFADQYRLSTEHVEAGLALARRVGDRRWEWSFLGQVYGFYALGEWDRLLEMAAEQPIEKAPETQMAFLNRLLIIPLVQVCRGDLAEAKRAMALLREPESSADVQQRAFYQVGRAIIIRAEGPPADALSSAESALSLSDALGPRSESWREALLEAVEASFELGDLKRVAKYLTTIDDLPTGRRSRYIEAHAQRFRARLDAARGDDGRVEPRFKAAASMFVEMEVPFWAAVSRLEHAEWLAERGRVADAQPLLAEALPVFRRLKAEPFAERARALTREEIETA